MSAMCSCQILFLRLVLFMKRDQMRSLPSILSLSWNEFYKFNNTGAQMLDSVYHMTFELLKNCVFGVKTSIFCHILRNVIMHVIT